MFSFKRTITVNHTLCGASNSTNFPMVFSGTYDGTAGEVDLRTTGNGGKVAQASGYDIAFYSDSGLTTLLNFERVAWDGATGAVEFWIQIPTLNVSTDSVIYIAYGDSGASDIQNKDATWRSEFKGVYHMQEASGDITDTSGNAHTGTATGTSSITGKVGKGRSFTLGSAEKIDLGNLADWDFGAGDFSIATWATQNNDGGRILLSRNGNTTYDPFLFGYNNVTKDELYMSSTGSSWDVSSGVSMGNMTFNNTTWYRIILTRIGDDFFTYQNGSQISTFNVAATLPAGSAGLSLGYGQSLYLTAQLDEVWFVKGLGLTSSWVTADYNNQSAPDSFYSQGAEQAVGGGGRTAVSSRSATGARTASGVRSAAGSRTLV